MFKKYWTKSRIMCFIVNLTLSTTEENIPIEKSPDKKLHQPAREHKELQKNNKNVMKRFLISQAIHDKKENEFLNTSKKVNLSTYDNYVVRLWFYCFRLYTVFRWEKTNIINNIY